MIEPTAAEQPGTSPAPEPKADAPTFTCRTPGCGGEAKAANGRHAFCLDCQVNRGTRRPDGSFIAGRIPTSPGSRTGRDRATAYGAFEGRALELVTAARALDAAIVAHDAAKARFLEAEAAVPDAITAWQSVLERLIDAAPVQPAAEAEAIASPVVAGAERAA